jgi:glycosyltransferase involved in cell wall biosynthesis
VKDIRLNFVGSFTDPSGYGQFARNFVKKIYHSKINISATICSFDKQNVDIGKDQVLFNQLTNYDNKPNIQIINTTPEFYEKLKNPYIKSIGFTMFETDGIPNLWVQECNKMDAIFVPCSHNKEVFLNSGVKVPIYVVSPGIEIPDLKEKKEKDTYKFYSIFQWTTRKGWDRLLKAYFSEFNEDDDVLLVLKTYRCNTGSQEQQAIKNEINYLKQNMRLKKFPPIYFIGDLLSSEQMKNLHESSDCFVLPTKGEGLGMPQMSSMAHGNPTISTNWSGQTEFMNKDNSILLDYQLSPVTHQIFSPWYESTMNWAEANIHQLKKEMRWCYENRDEADQLGKKGREYLKKEFNWNKRIAIMFQALTEVLEGKI